MAKLDELNDYERHFYDVMKARGYKHAIITDSYSTDARGVRLTHPEGTFRFEVEGFTFNIQTPKTESRGYGNRKKEIIKWYTLHHFFKPEEHEAMKEARIIPNLDDNQLVARIEATMKSKDEEESMRGIRQARRIALREAAPHMWRALKMITSNPKLHEPIEENDPMALQQICDALTQAGSQDPDDLSVARSGLAQSQHDTVG